MCLFVELHGVMAIILDFGSNDSGSTPGEAIALLGKNSTHDSLQFHTEGVLLPSVLLILLFYRLYYNKPRLPLGNNNKLVQSFLGNNSGLILFL